jgi:hypothetical protein
MLFAKNFGNFCFPKNIVDPPPPPRRRFFRGGPGMEGGPNFGIHPPKPETGWHGPEY